MTITEFTEVMADLYAAFPYMSEKQTQGVQRVYFKQLAGFHANQLQTAADRWIAQNDRFPTVIDLKRLIPGYITDEEVAGGVFRALMRDYEHGDIIRHAMGVTPKMNRSRPEDIAVLEKIGGMSRLAAASLSDETRGHVRRDFIRAYMATDECEKVRKLAGQIEASLGDNEERVAAVVLCHIPDVPKFGECLCSSCGGIAVKKAENEVCETFECRDCGRLKFRDLVRD